MKLNKYEELVRLMRTETNRRMYIKAPEDDEILLLCLRYGFGAVIDSAARQWQKRDSWGAFVVGPCRGSVEVLFNPTPKGYRRKTRQSGRGK